MEYRVTLLVAILTLPRVPAAQRMDPNVALGRPYTLSPAPDYPLTSDAGDATQLSDGRHADSGFWTDKAAVGWVGERVVTVTIDLGSEFEVSGASLSTAAGAAEVEWPSIILVLGSVDGHVYTLLGDLVALDVAAGQLPRAKGFRRHVFASHVLEANARFVRVMVGASGPYVFADEIEVFGQPAVSCRAPVSTITDTPAFFWRARAASRLRGEVQRRLVESRMRVSRARISEDARARLLARVAELEKAAAALSMDDWNAASAQYPMNEIHAGALAVIGAVEQLEGTPALRAWSAPPWDPIDMTTSPETANSRGIEVALMNGEVRSAALNVRNSTPVPFVATVNVASAGAFPTESIEVRPVAWSGDVDARPVALALLPPGPDPAAASVVVPAGVTCQVWLTFSPRALSPGVHATFVSVEVPGRRSLAVPVTVRVLEGRFPADLRLHVGGWDYLNNHPGAAAEATLTATASLLRDFGVDIAWATATAMPFGEFGPDGSMSRLPDTTVFDSWVARWRDAARYRVYVSSREGISGLRHGTREFDAAVRAWAKFWANHAATRGVPPDRIDILFVDEPRGDQEETARQLDWARALHASGAGFRVWLNPVYPDPFSTPPEFVRTSDTLCLNRELVERSAEPYREFAARIVHAGKTLEIYGTTGPASTLDPYAYYRLMAWRAFHVGATGEAFWTFTDSGPGTSWREYADPRPLFSPLFIDGSSVVPGKHLYAVREGAEDFEYLALLRDAIAREAALCPAGYASVAWSRGVLATAVRQVITSSRVEAYRWSYAKVRIEADAARLRIAEAVRRLSTDSAGCQPAP